MKKLFYIIILTAICVVPTSCKKFLEVQPLHLLSGNLFWQSKADADAFTFNLYGRLQTKFMSTAFIPASGELRSGYIRPATVRNFNSVQERDRRNVYNQFAVNNLRANNLGVLDRTQPWSGPFNFTSLTNWVDFYKVIQGANILYDQIERGVPGLSAAEENQYRAEASFLRNFCYFTLVRLYGDVVYYDEAYFDQPVPRENMVSVVNKCIADLNKHKDNLPLSFSDPAFRAVRATKGAATALLMHLNMWNAGFDKANSTKYYEATASLGNELIASNVYELVPIEQFTEVITGRSIEGIFEFNTGLNNGGSITNFRAFFGEMMLRYPNKGPGSDNNSSHAYFTAAYLQSLYPTSTTDKRRNLWFDSYWTSQDGDFQFLKFKGTLISNSSDAASLPEMGLILFRYADALLLTAEALADRFK
jgi:starch-binding outer membrane protein, SusD/RagB family